MPFKSEAQRRLFHAKEERGEMPHKTVEEWEHSTKNKKDLPYHKKKEAALFNELEKIAISASKAGRAAGARAARTPGALMKLFHNKPPLDAKKEALHSRWLEHKLSKLPESAHGSFAQDYQSGAIKGGLPSLFSKDKKAAAIASKKLKKVSMGMYC